MTAISCSPKSFARAMSKSHGTRDRTDAPFAFSLGYLLFSFRRRWAVSGPRRPDDRLRSLCQVSIADERVFARDSWVPPRRRLIISQNKFPQTWADTPRSKMCSTSIATQDSVSPMTNWKIRGIIEPLDRSSCSHDLCVRSVLRHPALLEKSCHSNPGCTREARQSQQLL